MTFTNDNVSLFTRNRLSDTLAGWLASTEEETQNIPRDQFLASSDEDLFAHLRSRLRLEPLVLHKNSMTMEEEEAQVEVYDAGRQLSVRGIRIVVSIPYSGEWALWHLRPSSYSSSPPVARDPGGRGSKLQIVMEGGFHDNGSKLRSLLDKNIAELEAYIERQARDIEEYNVRVDERIKRAVKERRNQLDAIGNIVSALDIPLKRRDGEPDFVEVPLERKLLPQPPSAGLKPEPGIAEEHYETILRMIRHTGRTFESLPDTFAVHGEEGLRDWILAGLNVLYEGGATGETFRKSGKTDIRIEDEERSAFVAECKVWGGTSKFSEALDQLCGYLTWRDCKCSLIVFNKFNSRFSEILEKIPVALEKHECFVSNVGEPRQGEWRSIFRSTRDGARRIVLHVFIFDVYSAALEEQKDTADSSADP